MQRLLKRIFVDVFWFFPLYLRLKVQIASYEIRIFILKRGGLWMFSRWIAARVFRHTVGWRLWDTAAFFFWIARILHDRRLPFVGAVLRIHKFFFFLEKISWNFTLYMAPWWRNSE